METAILGPAIVTILGIPAFILGLLIPALGVGALTYILARRMAPLVRAAPDSRLDNIGERLYGMYEIPHHRMPRYLLVSVIHISTLMCLIVLSLHVVALVLSGISSVFWLSGFTGFIRDAYTLLIDLALTVLLGVMIWAMIRRGRGTIERYKVPARYGADRTNETLLLLGGLAFIAVLDMVYLGSMAAGTTGANARAVLPMSGTWIMKSIFSGMSSCTIQSINTTSYFLLDIMIFGYVVALPFGRFFHFITAAPNVLFKKLVKGSVKPVKVGVEDDQLDDLESFGVKKFEDFTWKHMLDFYACTDCGRCSDNCPANAVGRPLSPRFISIKGREYAFKHYPLTGKFMEPEGLIIGEPSEGAIYSEDEIWSCTTCGACEEECPVTVEYIDKIVDLRRAMVDEGMVPQSLQKPLSALEKRGNPWGKMEKKRADWTKPIAEECPVTVLEKGKTAETLYFVDSITSFDERSQEIGQATAKTLKAAGIDFGILGKAEKDSGNEVRRFGEEMLFQTLKDHNTDKILDSGAKKIVTADPHALNALNKDYKDIPKAEHITETVLAAVKAGTLKFKNVEDPNAVYAFHDPCYLGRHSEVYDAPREVLDAIPGLNRVEMTKCKDRSFCCSGGGLMLFYEPEEEERMGVLRVEMAKEVGATVLVTACPFCLVNMEDAIKVAGMEGKMVAIDIIEIVEQHLA